MNTKRHVDGQGSGVKDTTEHSESGLERYCSTRNMPLFILNSMFHSQVDQSRVPWSFSSAESARSDGLRMRSHVHQTRRVEHTNLTLHRVGPGRHKSLIASLKSKWHCCVSLPDGERRSVLDITVLGITFRPRDRLTWTFAINK